MTHPPITMTDVEKILLSVSPVKPDGTPAEPAVTWVSSDLAQVGVEPVSGNPNQCWVTTPLESGKANVTASASGYEPETIPIVYGPGLKGKLNASAGAPEPD